MIAALAFGVALAPTPAPSPTSTLRPIAHVVTSDRSDESLARAARTTYVITKSQIVQNGYLTVADALASVPGVEIERYGGFGSLSSVSIRGSSSAEVLVLLDGMPVAGSQIASIDLGQIPTNGIERIEVVEGGGSTLYGSGSMGGIINVITATPSNSRAMLSAGSFGEQSLSVETPYVSIARTIAANDYPVPDRGVQQNADASLTSLRTGYAYDFGSIQAAFSGDLIDEHVGVPGAQGFYSPTSREGTVDRDARLDLSHAAPRSTLALQLGASTSDLRYACDTPVDIQCPNAYIAPPAPFAQLLTEERTMAELRNVVDNGDEHLVYGIDLSRGVARVDDGIDPLQIHPFDQIAAYVESQWFDSRGDEFYAGLRGERDGTPGGAFSPSIGGIETLAPDLQLRWNAATAFRAPTAEELYYPFFSNPGLAPEKTRVGDLTLVAPNLLGGVSFGWFTTDGTNLIADNPVTFIPENIRHAIIQGFTLEGRTRSYDGYSAHLGVTNLYRAQNLDDDMRIAGRGPDFTVGFGVDYLAPPQERFDGFGIETLSKGPRGVVDTTLPAFDQPVAYTRVDAYVGYRLTPILVLALRGFDLTNARYSEFGTYSASSVAFYAYPRSRSLVPRRATDKMSAAKEKVVFCWSGGKDSALALHRVLQDDRCEVVSLLTTCNEHFQRVSMHGVRIELAAQQARAIGLPLELIFLSRRSSNEEYQRKMSESLLAYKARGVTSMVFGDIFLDDLRRWREANLASIGLRGLFPLWKRDTRELISEFIDLGFGSVICCVNDAYLGEAALGRNIDREFVDALPPDVDPCGENGEFHSFAFAGPIFKEPLRIAIGEKVYRPVEETHAGASVCSLPGARSTKGFWFCDLLEATT